MNNKVINQANNESGITLIALIVMIIIVIVLSVVVIGNIGENKLIDTTAEVAQNHEVVSYREQIEQVVHNTIIRFTVKGETPTLIDIADDLNEEEWVRSAIANVDSSISNPDIIVTVDKGYVYQLFYDSTFGKVIIDYIGKDITEDSLPTLKARYEKKITSIIAEARDEKNGIAKLEFIYKGNIVGTINNPKDQEKFDISKIGTGWYQIKATSNKTGLFRYAWVKATTTSEKLLPPIITLSPNEPDGEEGWYKTPVNVTMTIQSSDKSAKDIHYRLVKNGITQEADEDKVYTGSFTIENLGITDIYAWTTDGENFQSEESAEELKIDNKAPTVEHTETSSKNPVGDWYIADVEIKVGGEDEHSGLNGYFYMVQGQNTTWIPRKMSEKLVVNSEGITTIAIKTIDKAGNESAPKTINIQKDTIKPEKPTIRQTGETLSSVTVEAIGIDNESGIGSYTFEIRPVDGTNDDWQAPTGSTINTESGTQSYTYSGISMGEHCFRVIVTDKAGNSNISDILTGTTVLNNPPVFSSIPTGSAVSGSNSQINVTATATDADGDTLTYTLWWGTSSSNMVETTQTRTASSGTTVTFNQTGLSNNTTYYFKVVVTDQKEETISDTNNARTYCLATYCSGGYYTYPKCTLCNGTGTHGTTTTTCGTCNGSGTHGTKTETCDKCNGTGTYGTTTTTCGTCNGSGNTLKRCNKILSPYIDNNNTVMGGYVCGQCGAKVQAAGDNIATAIFIKFTCPSHGENWGSTASIKVCSTTCYNTWVSSHNRTCLRSDTTQCEDCNGKGTITTPKTCDKCDGHKTITVPKDCTNCDGHGTITTPKTCTQCNGKGTTTKQNNCTHGYWGSHYRCSTHGNNVSQYH